MKNGIAGELPAGFQPLDSVFVESGVSHKTGEAFCRVKAYGPEGVLLVGQLKPDEVRGLAMQWLQAAEAAEAAEHDAAVLAELREIETPPDLAAAFLARLRHHRAEAHPSEPESQG